MQKLSGLSIFFPAYNDNHTIGGLIKAAGIIAKEVSKKNEIIVINDGSTDDTAKVLDKLKKQYPLRVITHQANRGYGGALISGFKSAKYDWIFYTDGDGQYDPGEITKLVSQLKPGIDVVNGYKLKRADTKIRTISGNLYNRLAHALYHLPIRDLDCDFRLIKASKLRKINLKRYSGIICLELVLKLQKAGAKFSEVGIHHYPRRFGRSQFFSVKHLLSNFRDLIFFRID